MITSHVARAAVAATCTALTFGLLGAGAAEAQARAHHPTHYAAARTAWKAGDKVSAAEQGRYWLKADQALAKSGRRYALEVRQLRTLLKTPDTGLSHTQIVRVRKDTKALNHFFRAPGLYL